MPGKRATAVCVWRLVFAFSPSHRCLTPHSWGTPCDIKAIYTSLKSTFSGLQFRRWQYEWRYIDFVDIARRSTARGRQARVGWKNTLSSFVWLLLPPKHEKCREIPKEFDFTAVQVQGHPRSSILVSMESPYATPYWYVYSSKTETLTTQQYNIQEIRKKKKLDSH